MFMFVPCPAIDDPYVVTRNLMNEGKLSLNLITWKTSEVSYDITSLHFSLLTWLQYRHAISSARTRSTIWMVLRGSSAPSLQSERSCSNWSPIRAVIDSRDHEIRLGLSLPYIVQSNAPRGISFADSHDNTSCSRGGPAWS